MKEFRRELWPECLEPRRRGDTDTHVNHLLTLSLSLCVCLSVFLTLSYRKKTKENTYDSADLPQTAGQCPRETAKQFMPLQSELKCKTGLMRHRFEGGDSTPSIL